MRVCAGLGATMASARMVDASMATYERIHHCARHQCVCSTVEYSDGDGDGFVGGGREHRQWRHQHMHTAQYIHQKDIHCDNGTCESEVP